LPAALQKLKDEYKFKRSLLPPSRQQGPLKLPELPKPQKPNASPKASPPLPSKRKSVDSSIETKLELSKVSSGVKPSNQTFGAHDLKSQFEHLQPNFTVELNSQKPKILEQHGEDDDEDISQDSLIIHQKVKEMKGNPNKFNQLPSESSGDATKRQVFDAESESDQEEVNVGGVKLHFPVVDEERKSKKSIATKKSRARR